MFDKAKVKNIFAKVQEVLFQAKSNKETTQTAKVSKVEELKGLKQLLDGVLTQEEFDVEKAKILNG